MRPKPPLLLAGPTAVGKSDVALCLAQMLDGELISVDSMQVYRGLDLGTAKPSRQEQTRVPHHLIDVVDLTESFDAARFVDLAAKAVAEIQGRGRLPILCGGTGLYFKAFLHGLGQAPPSDPRLRAEIESRPLPELLRELYERDPLTFRAIDRQNPRRVIRALEVIRASGVPLIRQRACWRGGPGSTPPGFAFFGLRRPLSSLHPRIDARVDEMFRRGLVTETAQLLERGLVLNRTASQALGYRQVVEFLQNKRSLNETIHLVKARTRQFAKRQMTWFSRQFDLAWIDIELTTPVETLAEQIAASWVAFTETPDPSPSPA